MINEIFGIGWHSGVLGRGALDPVQFQQENWLGGYGRLPRRTVRLAHNLAEPGTVNIDSGSVGDLALSTGLIHGISFAFIVASVSMPACLDKRSAT